MGVKAREGIETYMTLLDVGPCPTAQGYVTTILWSPPCSFGADTKEIVEDTIRPEADGLLSP